MMWGFGLGWMWMILVWLVMIGAIVWGVMWLAPRAGRHAERPGRGATDSDARQILDRRFARGEIDVAEYRRLREELQR